MQVFGNCSVKQLTCRTRKERNAISHEHVCMQLIGTMKRTEAICDTELSQVTHVTCLNNPLSSNSSIASLQIHQKKQSIWNNLQTPRFPPGILYGLLPIPVLSAGQQVSFKRALCSPAIPKPPRPPQNNPLPFSQRTHSNWKPRGERLQG